MENYMRSESTEKILSAYDKTHSIKGVAKETYYSWNRIVKALSSAGIVINDNHALILSLHEKGKTIEDIAKYTGLSVRTVQSYLPRIRPIYNENQSNNAKLIKKYRCKTKNEREENTNDSRTVN